MNDGPGQTAFPHQPPENDASYDELVDMVADSMRHAIGVQRHAREAAIQLTHTATTHTESVKDFNASVATLLDDLPSVVARTVGEKFNKAADSAANKISQRLDDANNRVMHATKELVAASSELRNHVATERMRRMWIGGAGFLGGAVFGALLVGFILY